jgi:hypothetical protein
LQHRDLRRRPNFAAEDIGHSVGQARHQQQQSAIGVKQASGLAYCSIPKMEAIFPEMSRCFQTPWFHYNRPLLTSASRCESPFHQLQCFMLRSTRNCSCQFQCNSSPSDMSFTLLKVESTFWLKHCDLFSVKDPHSAEANHYVIGYVGPPL